MENLEAFINSINFHSMIHLTLCVLSSVISVIFGIILPKWPIISTLIAISLITLVSGITGRKLTKDTKVSLIKTFFALQIILLCAWDFGGIVCVITISLDSKGEDKVKFLAIVITSCLVYIGAFVYFWKSFLVVNRLMIHLNNKSKYKSAGLRKYSPPDSGDGDSTDKTILSQKSRTSSRQMKENIFTVK
jgi:hypothetical protein